MWSFDSFFFNFISLRAKELGCLILSTDHFWNKTSSWKKLLKKQLEEYVQRSYGFGTLDVLRKHNDDQRRNTTIHKVRAMWYDPETRRAVILINKQHAEQEVETKSSCYGEESKY